MRKPNPKKPPVIRPGQKRPFIKGTAAEVQERIESVAQMLVRQATRGEIHKHVSDKWNKTWRAADTYIGRAKSFLRKQAQMTPEEGRAQGIGILIDVLRIGNVSQRLAAEKRLGEIIGYDAPRRQELSGPEGAPLALASAQEIRLIWPHQMNQAKVGGNGDDPKLLAPGGSGG